MIKLSLLILILLFGSTGNCSGLEWGKMTSEEVQAHNKSMQLNLHKDPPYPLIAAGNHYPFNEDLQEPGYIVLSDQTTFESRKTKEEILKNLPSSITPIVIITNKNSKRYIQKWKEINPKLVMITSLYRVDDFFWTRDSLPIPLYNGVTLKVVEAKYYYKKSLLGIDSINYSSAYNPFYFEGGNLIAHTNGECFTIANELSKDIPEFIYKQIYNCNNITFLPQTNGIGHVDERVRFISPREIVTDTPQYLNILKSRGFKVSLLPKYNKKTVSYLNFIKINNTIFLPTYRSPKDKVMVKYFRKKGFKVVPIDSYYLSEGKGSIHCISQTYPKVSLSILLNTLNSKELASDFFFNEQVTYNHEALD